MPHRQQIRQDAAGREWWAAGVRHEAPSPLRLSLAQRHTPSTQTALREPPLPASSMGAQAHSQSLGFFSSAVKMTAPPGRSGCGKG